MTHTNPANPANPAQKPIKTATRETTQATTQAASPSKNADAPNKPGSMRPYKVGDHDERPWGNFTVTATGTNHKKEEFCEKTITINPGHILSLQSHKYRKEVWTVQKGTLTVLLDGCKFALHEEESITVPKGSLHCMANINDTPCIVLERQEGICREDDITRYLDRYGRQTTTYSKKPGVRASIALYRAFLTDKENFAA